MNTASVIEFLLLLLIAASVIAVITSRLRIPYTIALVIAGFGIDLFQLPIRAILGPNATQILTPEVILIVFLPGLLFESGININVRLLRENLAPILVLAVAGVATATLLSTARCRTGSAARLRIRNDGS
ncbi:MAG: cation:proton antiporter [Bryobacteraceae bacterium]|nr:cation:proton antiporter [Bryobacteraceae bacterium]